MLYKAGLVKVKPDMGKIVDYTFKEHCGKLDLAEIEKEAKAWKAGGGEWRHGIRNCARFRGKTMLLGIGGMASDALKEWAGIP
jgi:hypothetical protein